MLVSSAMHARRQLCCLVSLALAVLASAIVPARAEERPRLETNEDNVRDVTRTTFVDVSKATDVLAFVLASLPDRVRVYPTENYYYFRFSQQGVAWAGSLRFGPDERDSGKLELSYYKALTDWNDEMSGVPRVLLGATDGVRVERVEALRYRVTQGERAVVFELNDLSQVKPPAEVVLPVERFLGPIFDESGVRFFFVYNSKLKIFHYILDETVPVFDELEPLSGNHRILIGRRTGFAYYRDHVLARKILIGVHEQNSRLNTWLDGPFDQLPENFIEGEALRAAIIESDPEARGAIDRLGHYLKEEGRYLIHPYMLYRKAADLLRVHACASQRLKRPDLYHRCFVIEPDATTLGPPPAPAKRAR